MKRALTGAILIHASAILFAAVIVCEGIRTHGTDTTTLRIGAVFGLAIGLLGIVCLIAAAIKSDIDPKD